ncbi:hypothetical protein AZH11_01950 [Pseudomonas simiae]|nr:hypothetical protein AZH11_01950 [Pseudomonas simiae]
MASNQLLGFIVLPLLIAGCASPTDFEEPRGDRKRTPLIDADEASIAKDYSDERSRNIPRVGLALSGGGTRAGMFAFGVLNGLNDTKVLDYIDVISSVSGGGYAAYWFYARRLEMPKGVDYQRAFADCRPDWWVKYDKDPRNLKLMEQGGYQLSEYGEMAPCTDTGDDEGQQWSDDKHDKYRWQAHIAQTTDLFRKRPMVFGGKNGRGPDKEAIPITALSLLEVLRFPFVTNGYFGQSYEEGITRTWGLTPIARDKARDTFKYANGEDHLMDGAYVAPGEHTWHKLRELSDADPSVPLWIVNATVLPKRADPNERAIFEVTQYGYGSDASGYVSIHEPPAGAATVSSSLAIQHPDAIEELPASVRASAAAADSQGLGTSQWRRAERATTVFPALRWGVTVEDTNLGDAPVSYRLSDGGGSDNLGLISLVKRGVKDIILVDAESDIEGRFEGLCWDKELLHQAGYDLKFDELQDLSILCAERTAERVNTDTKAKHAYNISAWLNPVMKGVITPLPSNLPPDARKKPKIPEMNVWLIKLAWNQALVQQALNNTECETEANPVSCMLTVYYAHQKNTEASGELYRAFPQIGTSEAVWNSSTPQFWAWRELGRSAGSLFVYSESGGLSLKTSKKLAGESQALLCGAPERQAVPCPPANTERQ